MNILFISENYYPRVSGVPVVVQYLAEGLAHKGHHVNVATCRKEQDPYKEKINGVSVYRHDIYLNFLKQPAGETKKYIDFVLKFTCDVIIIECTECITCDLLLPYLNRIHAKVLLHAHGFSGLCLIKDTKIFKLCDGFKHTIGHPYNWIRSWYYFKYKLPHYISYIDASMVLSNVDSAKEYLDTYLGTNNYILENAADDMFFEDYSSHKNPLNEIITLKSSRYCLSCANYSVVKDQKKLIEQFYKANINDLALICIGRSNNSYYNECIKLIKEFNKQYGYREVHLLYGIDRELIPIIESKATFYLVSSITEQYSISIIEAMAQGIPFISTNVGNASILPGGVTINSIEDMHQALQILATDKEQYDILSEKGKKYANTYNRKQKAVETLEKIIMTQVKNKSL